MNSYAFQIEMITNEFREYYFESHKQENDVIGSFLTETVIVGEGKKVVVNLEITRYKI